MTVSFVRFSHRRNCPFTPTDPTSAERNPPTRRARLPSSVPETRHHFCAAAETNRSAEFRNRLQLDRPTRVLNSSKSIRLVPDETFPCHSSKLDLSLFHFFSFLFFLSFFLSSFLPFIHSSIYSFIHSFFRMEFEIETCSITASSNAIYCIIQ